MLFCEIDQVGVCRIAFVSNMCRKEAGVWTQHTFRAHSVCVLNDLTSAQMVSTKLFGTIGVIQDHNIESHLVVPESLPRLFEQRGCVPWLAGKAITEYVPTAKDSNGWIRWILKLRYFSASGDKKP